MSFKALFRDRDKGTDMDFAYERGRDDFRKGRACPPRPPDDVDPIDLLSPEAVRWFGYMLERFKDFRERQRIAESLDCDPETVKPCDIKEPFVTT